MTVWRERHAEAATVSARTLTMFLDRARQMLTTVGELDGFEATRLIRTAEIGANHHTPNIAMTANAMQGDREACLAAGMDDYLSKPLRVHELQAMLERWHAPVKT